MYGGVGRTYGGAGRSSPPLIAIWIFSKLQFQNVKTYLKSDFMVSIFSA